MFSSLILPHSSGSAPASNASAWVRRLLRDHGDDEACHTAVSYLAQMVRRIPDTDNFDSLRGIEGECAKIYFSIFNKLILNNHEIFDISTRNRRPPQKFPPITSMNSCTAISVREQWNISCGTGSRRSATLWNIRKKPSPKSPFPADFMIPAT